MNRTSSPDLKEQLLLSCLITLTLVSIIAMLSHVVWPPSTSNTWSGSICKRLLCRGTNHKKYNHNKFKFISQILICCPSDPPRDVENFTCISDNWENLNCTWDEPWNPIKTYYTLKFKSGRSRFSPWVYWGDEKLTTVRREVDEQCNMYLSIFEKK